MEIMEALKMNDNEQLSAEKFKVPRPVRVTALEDDPLYLSMFRRCCIDSIEGLTWAGGFSDIPTFLNEVRALDAELYFLDIHVKGLLGLDCIKPLKKIHPEGKIIMLSVHDDDDFVLRSFLEGADGYLLKDSTPEDIFAGIKDVLEGGAPMSTSIARKVVRALKHLNLNPSPATDSMTQSGSASEAEVPDLPLSNREMEILENLAVGKKYQEIANELFIALATVKTHVRHIYEKLQVSNKTEAIRVFLGQK